ncbi:cytochrome b-c1 complex subunit 7 [Tetranychus urticae]|uniref:Cytochrome b-c1 complex subunit 7 n=1 Tax=Tetranychus urticae TaxID=32264 RepID=T1K9L0_TETUR|nr:cytochrome b-c1 complex subunit 7 [Tetranychus urticae]
MRLFRTLLYKVTAEDTSKATLGRLMFKLNEYCKFGLYHDDVYPDEEHEAVTREAVRRLPSEIYHARNFRHIQAMQLDIQKEYLPENQWTSYEDDLKNGRYLQPYIKEVTAELKEREDWEKNHMK